MSKHRRTQDYMVNNKCILYNLAPVDAIIGHCFLTRLWGIAAHSVSAVRSWHCLLEGFAYISTRLISKPDLIIDSLSIVMPLLQMHYRGKIDIHSTGFYSSQPQTDQCLCSSGLVSWLEGYTCWDKLIIQLIRLLLQGTNQNFIGIEH